MFRYLKWISLNSKLTESALHRLCVAQCWERTDLYFASFCVYRIWVVLMIDRKPELGRRGREWCFLRGDMEKKKDKKKKSFSNHEFFSEHWIKQRERVGASRVWGWLLQSCLNERVRCLMLGEGDERGEGDGEFVEHQSPLLSASHPAALPHSAHVS